MNAQETEVKVLIQTDFGDIILKLYNETPLHRNNFLKLIEEDFYRDLTFHRVIKDFMIQGGDPSTKNDSIDNEHNYTIPAEFVYPQYYHKRGALAAARLGDNINPLKESSSSQFYIVTGDTFSESELNIMEKQRLEKLKQVIFGELQAQNKELVKELYRSGEKEKLAQLRNEMIEQVEILVEKRKNEILFTPQQKESYSNEGGAPHLDGEYTVFGEVIFGMDVVDKIQNVATNQNDRPERDIRINIAVSK